MKLVIRGENLPRVERAVGASEISDEAACFAHQEDAGGNVPGLKVFLPEAIEPARRYPGEIERG